LRETWDAARIDDAATLDVIRAVRQHVGLVVDPHTAVGIGAARLCRRYSDVPMVVLATAHPAKFPDSIIEATGEAPEIPERLAAVADLVEVFDVLPNDLAVVEQHILSRTRVGRAN